MLNKFNTKGERMKIDLSINQKQLEANAKYFKERGVTLPTFAMMKNPDLVPSEVKDGLRNVGLWDLNPLNLYRISWKNEKKDSGGLYGDVNHIALPSELTGCKATIVAISGRWFPTGAHKVGATFGCLVPRLVTGQYGTQTKAVWPSTGNYCRGGAFVSNLLGLDSIAILPEEMSKERFEWLQKVAGETIATPGCESNVKEIFDKCWELRNSGEDLQIFNQFDELGNPTWHYNVTGSAVEELIEQQYSDKNFAGYVSSSGSGGTLAAGYYLKTRYPRSKIVVAEALQCPTILNNGFGGHRIEGIGDKHIPWVHNCKDTDFAVAVDDEKAVRLIRLFNEKKGREVLAQKYDVSPELVDQLHLLGISGIGNVLAAIKFAKHNELTSNDVVVTIATDSMQLYGSRLEELTSERGEYSEADAQKDVEMLHSTTTDYMKELGYNDRKAVHNLKYFTWIEQQAKDVNELNEQWYDHDNYWFKTFNQVDKIDEMILEFNDIIKKS